MSQVFPAEVEWDAVWAVKMGSCVQSSQVADHSSIPGSMQTVREKENGRFSNGSRSLFPPRSHQKDRPFVVPDRGTRQAGLLCSATLRTPPHLIPSRTRMRSTAKLLSTTQNPIPLRRPSTQTPTIIRPIKITVPPILLRLRYYLFPTKVVHSG